MFGRYLIFTSVLLAWFGSDHITAQNGGSTVVEATEESVAVQEMKSETKAVFRISTHFLDAIVGKQTIVADIPFSGKVIGLNASGVIRGTAKPKIEFETHGQQAMIVVTSQGNGRSDDAHGVKGPVFVATPMWGPFTTRSLIQFDGQHFTHLCSSANIDLRGCLAQIRGTRGGRIGYRVGRRVKPLAAKMMPKAVAQAKPLAERHVRDWVQNKTIEELAKVNAGTPIRASVNRLFPQTRQWGFQVSAQPEFIQAAFGPTDVPVPSLVHEQAYTEEVHIEVWLRSSGSEAQLLEKLSKNPLAKQLISKYLESTLPELAAVGTKRSVTAIGEWVVIRVGDVAGSAAETANLTGRQIADR